MAGLETHFTEPTTHYWQVTMPTPSTPPTVPYRYCYPALLPNKHTLNLPIRQLKNNPREAVASLLVNQASLDVVDELGGLLTEEILRHGPDVDVVVGLPTLGLSLSNVVARGLGHSRYVPMGYSKKFWYTSALSTDVSSITSPEVGTKKLYLDPHQLPLIQSKTVAIVDDAVSTGTTLKAAWDLLEQLGCDVVVVGVAMRQGNRWKEVLGPERSARLVAVFDSPLLRACEEGWVVRE